MPLRYGDSRAIGSNLTAVARTMADQREAIARSGVALKSGTVLGIGVWQDGRLSIDAPLARLFDLPAAAGDLSPADFLRRVHPEDHKTVFALARRARVTSGEMTAAFRLQRLDADAAAIGWRWVEARALASPAGDGKIARLTAVLVDIDTRRRVDLEVAQNEQTLKQIADSLPILVIYIAPDMTFRFTNRIYRTWFGDAGGGKYGTPVIRLLGQAIEDGPGEILRRCLAGERSQFDVQVRLPDGSPRDLEVLYTPRRVGEETIDGCYVIGIDITQRQEEARALNRSHSTLEQNLAVAQQETERVWRLSRDLLCVTDCNWTPSSFNPAWTTTLGWPPEVLLDRDRLEDLIHPDDRQRTDAARRALLAECEMTGFENRYRARNGGYRWLSWNAVLADGFIYAAARDITVEKEAAQQMRRMEDQFRQAQKMQAVGQLTGGIAHDFNNLLTGVIGSLEMTQNRIRQGRLQEVGKYIEAATGAAERAASMTHRLLAFSSRQTLEPKRIEADGLIDEIGEALRRAAGSAASLQIVRHGNLWSIVCDPRQLELALLNLVNNARDAMLEPGQLVIETVNAVLEKSGFDHEVSSGDYVAISVTDTGTGMAADVAARAFDPFFTTKPIGRGSGLGLSMVYGFARQSGGHAHIVSVPGAGSRVTIYLPRYRDAQPQAVPRSGPTVLLLEHEPMARMLLGDALGMLAIDTLEAVDGAGCLRVLKGEGLIDLLITAIRLPGGIDGPQLAELACALQPDLKVLLIGGPEDAAVMEVPMQGDGRQIIGRPFTLDGLVQRLRSILPL